MGSLTPYAITCPERVEISMPGRMIRSPATASASRIPATELWSVIAIPSSDSWRDRIDIECPDGSLQIRFRWRHTTFSWGGHTYSVTPMGWSRVTVVDQQRRPVVEARLTLSGIRLESLDAAFRPIERELAIGLAQRSLAWAMAIAPIG